MGNAHYLTKLHLVSICVALTGSVPKASWKFVCGFFLPRTNLVNIFCKGTANLEF